MNILISSDTVCDLPKEIINKYNIPLVSIPINLGNETFLDEELTSEKIFKFVDEHKILPKTSAINEYTYNEFFTKQLKTHDAIIHFTLSSKVSSCFQNAYIASQKFENVFVIDTQNLSSGVGINILHALKLKEKGLSAQEIYNEVLKQLPKTQTTFVIEKLDFLHKGGRCSSLQLLGANLLKIRPSILVKDGKLEVYKKYKGKMHDVVRDFVEETLKEHQNYDDETCFIVYSSATEEMLNAARETLNKHANFKNIIETKTSSTITSHCGKNTLGLIFYNK